MGILERISKLDDSFCEGWQTGKYSEEFHTTYQKLSNDLAELEFTGCFVDMSTKFGWVDINLWFDNGLFMSVCRPIDATDDIDFFSISRNKKKNHHRQVAACRLDEEAEGSREHCKGRI